MATFVQAFLIVFFVHWVWYRFDLSPDAVIKYFACIGFIITTSTALCFELLESVFFNERLKLKMNRMMKVMEVALSKDLKGILFIFHNG